MIDKLRISARVALFIEGTELGQLITTGSDLPLSDHSAEDISLVTKLYERMRRDGSAVIREVTDAELDTLAYYSGLLLDCSQDDQHDRQAARRMLDTIDQLRQGTR